MIVQGGEDDNKKRAAATMKGTKGEKHWYVTIYYIRYDIMSVTLFARYARLNYFFEIGGQSQAHVQWYQHGSQILLQEVAHQNMLYLIDECDDINLGAIWQKVEVHTLAPTEDEPSHVSDGEVFFTGYVSHFSVQNRSMNLQICQSLLGSGQLSIPATTGGCH